MGLCHHLTAFVYFEKFRLDENNLDSFNGNCDISLHIVHFMGQKIGFDRAICGWGTEYDVLYNVLYVDVL